MQSAKQYSQITKKLLDLEKKVNSITKERDHYKSVYFMLLSRLQPILELHKIFDLQTNYKILRKEVIEKHEQTEKMMKLIEQRKPYVKKLVKQLLSSTKK